MDLAELRTLTLDLPSVTLGEMAAIEMASGTDFTKLLRSAAGRRLIALYLRESRSSGVAPSWSSLSSLRPLDNGSLTSSPAPDGIPTPSGD